MSMAPNSFSRLREAGGSGTASRVKPREADDEGDLSHESIACVQGEGCSVVLTMQETGPQVIFETLGVPERQILFLSYKQ